MREFSEIATVSGAARLADVAATTLKSAIQRGEIETHRLACGQVVVLLADVTDWQDRPRATGRPMRSRWYVSAAAVHQYSEIAGIPQADDGPDWDRAERELLVLVSQAPDKPKRKSRKFNVYHVRAKLRGKSRRLELMVSDSSRDEGDLPQLVAVRDRDQR